MRSFCVLVGLSAIIGRIASAEQLNNECYVLSKMHGPRHSGEYHKDLLRDSTALRLIGNDKSINLEGEEYFNQLSILYDETSVCNVIFNSKDNKHNLSHSCEADTPGVNTITFDLNEKPLVGFHSYHDHD